MGFKDRAKLMLVREGNAGRHEYRVFLGREGQKRLGPKTPVLGKIFWNKRFGEYMFAAYGASIIDRQTANVLDVPLLWELREILVMLNTVPEEYAASPLRQEVKPYAA
jgi:hypothetical protein